MYNPTHLEQCCMNLMNALSLYNKEKKGNKGKLSKSHVSKFFAKISKSLL